MSDIFDERKVVPTITCAILRSNKTSKAIEKLAGCFDYLVHASNKTKIHMPVGKTI